MHLIVFVIEKTVPIEGYFTPFSLLIGRVLENYKQLERGNE